MFYRKNSMGIIILITKSKKKKKNCDNSSTEKFLALSHSIVWALI